jgi:hypothetical protein
MNNKLSFYVPSEYENLQAFNDIKTIKWNKEHFEKLKIELEIIDEQINKYTELNDELKLSEYTILKHFAIKYLEQIKN